MRKVLLLVVVLFQGGSIMSQTLTHKYIDDRIEISNPDINTLKKSKLFIIEGIPYDRKQLDDRLNAFKTNNPFFYLKILSSDSVRISCMRPNLIIVLIGNANELKLRKKKKILNDAQGRFIDIYNFYSNHIHANSKDPVLFVDDKKIHHAESKRIINQLSANKIKHLIVLNDASLSLYGTNAVNGLIRIWTKRYYDETYL